MERIRFVQHKGKSVLIEDFSNLGPGEEFRSSLDAARKIIRSQPQGSVLALFDATGMKFNNEMVSEVKAFVKGNTPYIRAAAVVGVAGLLHVALTAISRFSGRPFNTFSDRRTAMEWLVAR